jgi:hypothetical protein
MLLAVAESSCPDAGAIANDIDARIANATRLFLIIYPFHPRGVNLARVSADESAQ